MSSKTFFCSFCRNLRKAELELSRLRRDDSSARKNLDGLEHMQSKVENLTTMNTLLKEQLEAKERHGRELEDRLRRQSEEMKQARLELDNQHKKLKKREQLISSALKRLEAINSMQMQAGAMQQALASLADPENHPSAGNSPTKSRNIEF